jgi:hypothetical protein
MKNPLTYQIVKTAKCRKCPKTIEKNPPKLLKKIRQNMNVRVLTNRT